MDDAAPRERAIELVERWDRTGRLEAVRRRLFRIAAAGVLAAVLLPVLPDAGTITPALIGLARLAGLGLAVFAYSVRTALEDPDRLRAAEFENELIVGLGTYALGGLYGATRESAPAAAVWRLLFREAPASRGAHGSGADSGPGFAAAPATGPTAGSGPEAAVDETEVAAWRSRLRAGAVVLLAIVVAEQVGFLLARDSPAVGLPAVGLPGGVAVPELSPGATAALLVGAVVAGGVIGLLLAVSRA